MALSAQGFQGTRQGCGQGLGPRDHWTVTLGLPTRTKSHTCGSKPKVKMKGARPGTRGSVDASWEGSPGWPWTTLGHKSLVPGSSRRGAQSNHSPRSKASRVSGRGRRRTYLGKATPVLSSQSPSPPCRGPPVRARHCRGRWLGPVAKWPSRKLAHRGLQGSNLQSGLRRLNHWPVLWDLRGEGGPA